MDTLSPSTQRRRLGAPHAMSEKTVTRNALPKSRAKTAYGLLSEIAALIVEEPKRYNQHDTLDIRGRKQGLSLGYAEYPNCGTVGCVAGWVAALISPRPSRVQDVLGYAGRVLGLSVRQQDCLVSANAAGPERQTVAHAQRGVEHIRRFQKRYRAQLLAKKLDVTHV